MTGARGPKGDRGPRGNVVLPASLVWKVLALNVLAVFLISFFMAWLISGNAADNAVSRQTHAQCVRTIRFSPYIGVYLKRQHVFPPKVQAAYEATIPQSCPG